MKKIVTGLVGVASHDESGGQRAGELLAAAKKTMEAQGVEVIEASRVIWNPSDAVAVCDEFKNSGIESLVILNVTWVADSLLYVLIHNIEVPFTLWAVPFTETFSLGCVQHMGATLGLLGIPFQPLYGAAEDPAVSGKLMNFLKAAHAIALIKNMKLALLGPRQTWRVAGPQDMSMEEWEFSETFGTTIIHLEMDEVTDRATNISDDEARKVLETLAPRTGKTITDEETMLYAAKVYTSLKAMMKDNGLTCVAAECYPKFDGLTNLSASWLADEHIVVETEGDIAHVMLREAINNLPGPGVTMLGESGSYDVEQNYLFLSHGGSTAQSAADDASRVQISPSGVKGTYVGTPIKAMDTVTVSNLVGCAGNYKMLIARGQTVAVSDEDYDKAGRRLALKLRFDVPVEEAVNGMLKAGLDHHLVIREGDYTETLCTICDLLGVEKVII